MKSPPDKAGLAKIAFAHALSIIPLRDDPYWEGMNRRMRIVKYNNMIPIVVNIAIGSFLSADQRGNGVGGDYFYYYYYYTRSSAYPSARWQRWRRWWRWRLPPRTPNAKQSVSPCPSRTTDLDVHALYRSVCRIRSQ